MEPFRDVLEAGGHTNSLGRAGEVLAVLTADPARTDELWRCVFADDAWVRMRAIDTFEKLVRAEPGRAAPYVASMLDDLTGSDQPSIQWHLAQLFALVRLSAAQRERAVAWLRDRLATTEVDWIVAAQAMRALVDLGDDPAVLRPLLTVQLEHRSASVRRKAAAFLDAL